MSPTSEAISIKARLDTRGLNVSMPCQAEAISRTPEVPLAIQRLERTISGLMSVVSDLEKRLEPVLNSNINGPRGQSGESCEKAVTTPLAEEIERLEAGIEQQSQRILHLLEFLEL